MRKHLVVFGAVLAFACVLTAKDAPICVQVPGGWQEVPVNLSPVMPSKRFIPTNAGRKAECVITVLGKIPLADLTPNKIRGLHITHCKFSEQARPEMKQVDSMIEEVIIRNGSGFRSTYENPEVQEDASTSISPKFITLVTLLSEDGVQATARIYTEEKTGATVDESLLLVASLKLSEGAESKSVGRAKEIPASRISRKIENGRMILSLDDLDAALSFPDDQLKPSDKPRGGAGFFAFNRADGLGVSGSLLEKARYGDFRTRWSDDKKAVRELIGLEWENENFTSLDGWQIVTHEVRIVKSVQTNLRAYRVCEDTAIDLRLSRTGEKADLETLMAFLKQVSVQAKFKPDR